MPDADQPRPDTTRKAFRTPMVLAAVVIAAVIGFVGIYGIGGLTGNHSGDPTCRPAVDLAKSSLRWLMARLRR